MDAGQVEPGLWVRGSAPPLNLRDFELVAFDIDSTLINIERVDEIAAAAGRKAEVATITEAAVRGDITAYHDSWRRCLALLQGVPLSALEAAHAQHLQLKPGVEVFIQVCQAAGPKTLLISAGLNFFSERVRAGLKLDFARANLLEIDEGKLPGAQVPRPWGEVVDGAEKRRLLLEVAELKACCAIEAGAPTIRR